MEKYETLYDAIAHGDEEHRAWLKEAIDNHFSGLPVPPPGGKGRTESLLQRAVDIALAVAFTTMVFVNLLLLAGWQP